MNNISEVTDKIKLPEKVIQFGEGGFLRGFFDWMLQKANDSGVYTGSAVIVQPIEQGMCDKLTEQNCLYTHIIRGVEGVEVTPVKVISRCVKPYEDYRGYLSLADNPDTRVIVSNTTESGIRYEKCDFPHNNAPKTFPAKLTALLYRRFLKKLDGFLILPCELIDKNGTQLKKYVMQYASDWGLEKEFSKWIETENTFCNTLVDRIVPGYPREEKIDLPYTDNMVNTSEYFHLWVIEGDKGLSEILPFERAGLNVIWTDDLQKYRTRKVRILNGAHTATVAYAMLNGFETVKNTMDDAEMYKYIHSVIFDEIVPTLKLPKNELEDYANSVLERFKNPHIMHYWASISLNSVSKFKVRVLPSILEYKNRFGVLPEKLVFSLYSLIKLYKTIDITDSPEIVAKMKNGSISEILSDEALWGTDLSFLLNEVSKYEDKQA